MPLYTEEDARRTLELVRPGTNIGEPIKIGKGIQAEFRIAGHILGSSVVLLSLEGAGADGAGRRVLFSGDLGRYDQPIIHDPVVPPTCDYLLVESTYGDRLHDPEDPKETLARVITHAAERRGPILIPAFAVGRTQEIVYLIRELEEEGRSVFTCLRHSLMAAAYTEHTAGPKNRMKLRQCGQAAAPVAHQVDDDLFVAGRVKALNQVLGARIVISASGMMNGGRVPSCFALA